MPVYVFQAVFVTCGLMLSAELIALRKRTSRPAPRFLIDAGLGVASLLMANAVGGVFGLGLGLNALTVPAAALLGPPGTALLWAIRYLL